MVAHSVRQLSLVLYWCQKRQKRDESQASAGEECALPLARASRSAPFRLCSPKIRKTKHACSAGQQGLNIYVRLLEQLVKCSIR